MGEPLRPPPFVICHLCGRKYGTKSIAIHVPQCQEKWEAENRKLPKQLRRTVPNQPDYDLLRSGHLDSRVLDEVNAKAFESSQAQLIPCKHCGRTFYPEKLPVHLRSCTAENPSRPPPSSAPVVKARADDHVEQKSVLKYNNRKNSDSKINDRNLTNSRAGNITRKLSDSRIYANNSNDNIDDEGSTKLGTVKEAERNYGKEEDSATTLCCICMEQIPSQRIQIHLVCCNEEKAKQILTEGIEAKTKKAARPRTRTLHRGPPSVEISDSNGSKPDTSTNKVSHSNPPSEQNISETLVGCDMCGRKFANDRINQHKSVCLKNAEKRTRKTFDSSKQRTAGLDLHSVKPLVKTDVTSNRSGKDKSNWRAKHQELIQSIRNAKKVAEHMSQGGKASDLPPPAPSLNPDYVHCKFCDRRFNPEVAERHIPKCATTRNRPAPPKKKAVDVYNADLNNNRDKINKNGKNNVNNTNINTNIKQKSVKKTSTFNVERNPAFNVQDMIKADQLSGGKGKVDLSATYNLQKARKEKKGEMLRGYISPTPGKGRYDSFEEVSPVRSKSSRPSLSSKSSRMAATVEGQQSSSAMLQKTMEERANTGYSYNNSRRKQQGKSQPSLTQPDFVF